MLERGELSQVTADLTLAHRLIESAKRHLKSAAKLGEDDPELAYAANAVRAQFAASMGALLRPIDRIRATRHAVEYLDEETWLDADAVHADLPKAQKIVDAAGTTVGHLTVFQS